MALNNILVVDVPTPEGHSAGAVDITTFVVPRRGLRPGQFIRSPDVTLAPGEALLQIDRFALSGSNLARAAIGEESAEWQVFPTRAAEQGVIPVWGFADVVASCHGAIQEGERIFGLFPMATHAVIRPAQVQADRFIAGNRRADLPAIYNLYRRSAADAAYDPAYEDLQSLLRPLFMTSFLIDDYLESHAMFGAEAVLVSSAMSRPACALVQLLQGRAKRRYGLELIGLTATGCQQAGEELGCYDYLVSYDAIGSLPPDQPTAFVDLTGSSVIRSAVHDQYGDNLMASLAVDLACHDAVPLGRATPGPQPIRFRPRAHLQHRLAEWGHTGLDLRFAEAWREFAGFADDWLTIRRARGRAGIQAAYMAMLEGQAKPDEGHILSFWD